MADCMTLRSHTLRLTDSRKVALVTGRSGGIGKAVVQRLADDNFTIVAHYAGNPS
ncbi:short-chain dehydrogenase/reductase SDR [Paraburkholderia hospita]|uniref:Short-chain dehydrogenase/reductase SDR n=1 Tax=Paraburkholderia hospita TaxID=169430 RepID=A0ABP2PHS7_9BURK|nr:short-chain dehydrogenase/reductase SDR [Paraburkholderia hospita]